MRMTFEEYSRRVLGEGSAIDLSIQVEESHDEAIMLVVESTPYVALLQRIKNLLVKYDSTSNSEYADVKPIYLKIIGKPVLNIGNIDVNIYNINNISKILKRFNPKFYYVNDGVVGDLIEYQDLANTINITGGKLINEYI